MDAAEAIGCYVRGLRPQNVTSAGERLRPKAVDTPAALRSVGSAYRSGSNRWRTVARRVR
jgi:hypothetical protein